MKNKPKAGRPPKIAGEKLTVLVNLRLTPSQAKKLRALKMGTSDAIRMLIDRT